MNRIRLTMSNTVGHEYKWQQYSTSALLYGDQQNTGEQFLNKLRDRGPLQFGAVVALNRESELFPPCS